MPTAGAIAAARWGGPGLLHLPQGSLPGLLGSPRRGPAACRPAEPAQGQGPSARRESEGLLHFPKPDDGPDQGGEGEAPGLDRERRPRDGDSADPAGVLQEVRAQYATAEAAGKLPHQSAPRGGQRDHDGGALREPRRLGPAPLPAAPRRPVAGLRAPQAPDRRHQGVPRAPPPRQAPGPVRPQVRPEADQGGRPAARHLRQGDRDGLQRAGACRHGRAGGPAPG
mmetsp:Transcript_110495/g.307820  ORF Transcript_110495/g.307820 Transcript_110495/m.307820 type:complete len:225 (+) Transcript_110495:439-1113(+)